MFEGSTFSTIQLVWTGVVKGLNIYIVCRRAPLQLWGFYPEYRTHQKAKGMLRPSEIE